MPARRILVTGASGSGTTTLGRAVARRLGYASIDADDFVWVPTDPPYQEKLSYPERLAGIIAAVAQPFVVSGSVLGWGESLEESFDLVVFLWVPAPERVTRLRRREQAELGSVDEEFIAWAAQYDEGRLEGRSLRRHEEWLARRRCPVVRIEGAVPLDRSLAAVLDAMLDAAGGPGPAAHS